jgi:hypothetical protein
MIKYFGYLSGGHSTAGVTPTKRSDRFANGATQIVVQKIAKADQAADMVVAAILYNSRWSSTIPWNP